MLTIESTYWVMYSVLAVLIRTAGSTVQRKLTNHWDFRLALRV